MATGLLPLPNPTPSAPPAHPKSIPKNPNSACTPPPSSPSPSDPAPPHYNPPPMTATLARPSAARLCVEIDLRKPPPQFIWVGLFDGFKQPILYEKLPKFCNGCHIQGHSTVECSKSPLDNPIHHAEGRSQATKGSTPSVRHNASTKPNPVISLSQNASTLPLISTSYNIVNPPIVAAIPPEANHPSRPSSYEPGMAQAPPPPLPITTPALPTESQPTCFPSPSLEEAAPSYHNISTHQSTAIPSLNHPITPLKPDKQQRKSVAFRPQKPNLEANQELWNAENSQIALIEQARLKAPIVDAGHSPITTFSSEDHTPLLLPEDPQSTPDLELVNYGSATTSCNHGAGINKEKGDQVPLNSDESSSSSGPPGFSNINTNFKEVNPGKEDSTSQSSGPPGFSIKIPKTKKKHPSKGGSVFSHRTHLKHFASSKRSSSTSKRDNSISTPYLPINSLSSEDFATIASNCGIKLPMSSVGIARLKALEIERSGAGP